MEVTRSIPTMIPRSRQDISGPIIREVGKLSEHSRI